jgi:hypothetical protein
MLAVADSEDMVSDDQLIFHMSPHHRGRAKALSLLSSHGMTLSEPRRLNLLEFVEHDLGLLKPLMRRSFLRQRELRYDADLKIGADFFLYFGFLLAGARWLQLPNGYYLYSEHSENTSKDTVGIARDVAKSTETLLRHPGVAADPVLTRALQRRAREWESNEAFAIVSDLLLQRRGAEFVRLLVTDPSSVARAMEKIVRSPWRWALWRISSLWGQRSPPARFSLSERER